MDLLSLPAAFCQHTHQAQPPNAFGMKSLVFISIQSPTTLLPVATLAQGGIQLLGFRGRYLEQRHQHRHRLQLLQQRQYCILEE